MTATITTFRGCEHLTVEIQKLEGHWCALTLGNPRAKWRPTVQLSLELTDAQLGTLLAWLGDVDLSKC